ncbi:MAG: hypothetical protein IPM06_13195 [Rhizobiales bacterium]|nr:hypothetical protein [Hyphomicrobiales bacterium]
MKGRAAIALALLLAGCTASDQLLLQQDFKRMADLPNQLGKPRTGTPETPPATTAAVDPAPTPTPTPEPAPPPDMANPAAVTDAPPPSPPQAQSAPAQGIAVAETARKKPTLFDALGVKKQAAPVEPPGAYDQIQDPIVVENPLARPPWEVFMEAGPNAHRELDLETLYGPGHIPADMQAKEDAEQAEKAAQQTIAERQLAAQQAGEQLAEPPPDEPVPEEAAPTPAKPEKTTQPETSGVAINAVAVPVVKGAKGKGNGELTRAMRNALTQAGWPVLEGARKDALTVQGRVTLGTPHGATQSVKIVWDVLTPDGKSLGNLKQDNAIPAGSLDQSWGENAQYAADAAAEGIFKLIQKYR